MSWPAIRTRPAGWRDVPLPLHLLVAGLALLAIPLCGLLLGSLSDGVARLSPALGAGVSLVALAAVFGIFFSWMGMIPLLPCAILALRYGYGGWLVALAGGAVIGAATGAFLALSEFSARQTGVVFAATAGVSGAAHALAYMSLLRAFTPAAMGLPAQPPGDSDHQLD